MGVSNPRNQRRPTSLNNKSPFLVKRSSTLPSLEHTSGMIDLSSPSLQSELISLKFGAVCNTIHVEMARYQREGEREVVFCPLQQKTVREETSHLAQKKKPHLYCRLDPDDGGRFLWARTREKPKMLCHVARRQIGSQDVRLRGRKMCRAALFPSVRRAGPLGDGK